jgi:tetratricopeptide (TPR) repeat protein/nucleotide-binding universal stress UspA family protein
MLSGPIGYWRMISKGLIKSSAFRIASLVTVTVLSAELACPSTAEPKRRTVAIVIPFENLAGRPEYNWVGESFSELLAELFDQPGSGLAAIQSDERDVAYKQAGLPPTAILTRATMIKIAERAGADLIVMGTYRVAGEGRESSITVTARTINVREGRLVGREFNRGGPLIELQRLQAELAYEILYQNNPALPLARDQFIAEATRIPIGAFENYIKGKLTRDRDARIVLLERAIKECFDKTKTSYSNAVFELGRAHYDVGNYKEALEQFEKLPEKDARFQEALFYMGVARDFLGQADEALQSFMRLAQALPLYEVYNNIGVLLIKKKQYGEAIKYLKPASDAAPRDTDTLFNLGYAYFLQGDYTKAVAVLSRSVERWSSDGEAFYLLSKSLGSRGDQVGANQASDHAKKLLKAFAQWETKGIPFLGRIKTAFSKANYYRYKRELDLSITPQSALSIEVSRTDQLLEAARGAFFAGRDDEALSSLSKLLEVAPQNYEAHLLMGRVYERRGQLDRATNSLKAALFWNPKLVPAHVLLGRISLLRNDCQSAQASASKALQIDPDDQDAQALKRLVEQNCK